MSFSAELKEDINIRSMSLNENFINLNLNRKYYYKSMLYFLFKKKIYYFSLPPLKSLETMTDPFTMIPLMPRVSSTNNKRNQGSWEKEIILGLRPGYVKNEPGMSFCSKRAYLN